MSQRNTCERHVGRLLEVRVAAGFHNVADIDAVIEAYQAQSALVPSSQRLVLATDWSACSVMAEDAAKRLAAIMRVNNPRIERNAVLLPVGSPVARLQFSRLLRESDHSGRRGFDAPSALVTWLSEVLDSHELTRLHAFIAGER